MLPTCSKSPLAGRNALSAAVLTIVLLQPGNPSPGALRGRLFDGLRAATPTVGQPVSGAMQVHVGAPKPRSEPRLRWYVARALGSEIATSAHPSRRLRGSRGARVASVATFALVSSGGRGLWRRRAGPGTPPSLRASVPGRWVVAAKFLPEQRLAETSDLRLEIKNSGDENVPDLAVTKDKRTEGAKRALRRPGSSQPGPPWIRTGLSGSSRRAFRSWFLPRGPRSDFNDAATAGAAAAQTNTFLLRRVTVRREQGHRLAGHAWVTAGTYTVHYELAAGLGGKAKAVTGDGSPVEGEFVVTITDKPPRARVDDSGQVVIEDK